MKLTKKEQWMQEVVAHEATVAWTKYTIMSALEEAFESFEEDDEYRLYMSLLNAHFYADELEALQ